MDLHLFRLEYTGNGDESFFNRKILIYRDSTQDEVKRIWRYKIVCKESREYYLQQKKS